MKANPRIEISRFDIRPSLAVRLVSSPILSFSEEPLDGDIAGPFEGVIPCA
jgi:hypothetical protein